MNVKSLPSTLTIDFYSCSVSQALKGDKEAKIKPFLIKHGILEGLTTMRPHQYIYAPYNRSTGKICHYFSSLLQLNNKHTPHYPLMPPYS